eukprot:1144852-Pelagomonas_calceolata.AAC.3
MQYLVALVCPPWLAMNASMSLYKLLQSSEGCSYVCACSEWCGITRGALLTEALHKLTPYTLYIGVGRAQMSRADMFRQPSGTAVLMEQSIFPMPVPVQVAHGDHLRRADLQGA